MGGRGGCSNYNAQQPTLDEERTRLDIEKIIQENDKKRALSKIKNGNIGGGKLSSIKKKKCVCCGELTITVGSTKEKCPVCGWIDDPYQNRHPDSLDGAIQLH
jgi:rubrerythrin